MYTNPLIVVVMGLPGSGKTYFAEHLTRVLSAEHISSDQVRNEHGQRGRYQPSDKLQVYHWMLEEAEEALAGGHSVVLDATFHRQAYRRRVEDWATAKSCPLYYIELRADDATTRERTYRPRSDSQANYAVYRQLRREAEPLETPHLQLDSSSQPVDTMVQTALDYLTDDA